MPDKIISALRETLNIKRKEKVLIVTDTRMWRLAKRFYAAAKRLCSNVDILKIKVTGRHGKEPTAIETAKMLGYDVLILLTYYSLTHTDARRKACKAGARIASMPGFTMRMMKALTVNYKKMQRHSIKLWKILDAARKKKSTFHVTTKSGTDLTFKILEKVYRDFGKIRKGEVDNLPAGEVFFAPKDAEGILVFDRYEKEIRKPTILLIAGNRIIGFQKSKGGRTLKKLLNVKGGNVMAEFGIGTNQNAKLIGNTLQDEKVKGTCHIAFGNNVSIGGKNNAKVHIDIILLRPTIRIGNKVVIRNG